MAATGYTPISLYYSTTASAVPTAGNLADGELALNIADMKLYAKNSSGTVTLLASNASTTPTTPGGSTTQVQYNSSGSFAGSANMTFDGTSLTLGGNPTISSGTANGVTYLNGSKALTSGSALQFDGTNLGVAVTPSTWLSTRRVLQIGQGGAVVSASNSGVVELSSNWYSNAAGTSIYIANGAATRYQQNGGAHNWYSAASGTAGNTITFTSAMALDASGNLGLGVTPQTWYTGKAFQIGSYTALSDLSNATRLNNNAYYNAGGTATYINTAGASEYLANSGVHTFKVAGSGTSGTAISWTSALVINASGALGVGSGISYGNAGEVLTSAGSGAAPTWVAASSGGVSTAKAYFFSSFN